MRKAKVITVSVLPEMMGKIRARGKTNTPVIISALETLWGFYEEEMKKIDLTLDEACSITETVMAGPFKPEMLWFAVETRVNTEKWNVNVTDLVAYLQKLTPLQTLAIIDCAEQAALKDYDFRERVKRTFRLAIKEVV